MTVDDKNITLASGSVNAAAASGAGFTVDIGSGTNPAITYDGTNDEWDFNKDINVTGNITTSTTLSSFHDRVRIVNGSAQLNMGQWDGTNHRIEADSNRPLKIYSYNTTSGIALGISGSDKLTINGNGSGITVAGGITATGGLAGTTGTFTSTSPTLSLVNTTSTTGKTFQFRNLSQGEFDILDPSSNSAIGINNLGCVGIRGRPAYDNASIGINLFSDSTTGATLGTRIQNNGAGRLLDVNSSAGTKFTVLNNGNVGIGKTDPGKILDLQSTDGLALRFYNSTTFKGGLEVVTTDGQMISTSVVDDFAIRSQSDMLFATGGNTERVRIDSSGNVGIGTTAATWAKLDILGSGGAQTGATQALQVKAPSATAGEGVGIRLNAASGSHEAVGIIGMVNNTSGNAGAMTFHTYNLGATIPERMRIDNLGNVGIGTDDPGYKLEVSGTAYVNNTLTAGSIAIPTQGLTLNQAFGTGVPTIHFRGTADNGRAGALWFQESDGSGGHTNTAALYATDGAGGNSTYGGLTIAAYQSDIRFSTGTLAGTKMIVQAGGNVGIGTTSPTAPLSIRKVHATAYGSGIDMLDFKAYYPPNYDTETSKASIFVGTSDKHTLNTHGGYLAFKVNSSGYDGANGATSLVEYMRIEKDGNVGIGHQTPSAGLHIKKQGRNFSQHAFYDGYESDNGLGGTASSIVGSQVGERTHSLILESDTTAGADVGASIGFRARSSSGGTLGDVTYGAIVGAKENSELANPNGTYDEQSQGYLGFYTSAGYSFGPHYGTLNYERMRISSSGKVGIGTDFSRRKIRSRMDGYSCFNRFNRKNYSTYLSLARVL